MRRLFRSSLLALSAILTFGLGTAAAQGFNATHSKDGTDVWAVGDSGRVLRSIDGGLTYAASTVGTSNLRAAAHRGLTVLLAGDGGHVRRSTDNGGSFADLVLGGMRLRGLAMPSSAVAFVVGDGGSIFRSIDGGASWTPLTSGTSNDLYAVAFSSTSQGFAVGDQGTVLRTLDGGDNWSPVAVGLTARLLAVATDGTRAWFTGERGVAQKSIDGGSSFTPVNLGLDARSDVRAVALAGSGEVWVAGGGGFVRRSMDDGSTWTFIRHGMHSPISGLALGGARGFAVATRARTPLAGLRAGASWSLPTGATVGRSWASVRTTSSSIRGSTLTYNPWQPDVLYALMGATLWRSPDAGETWATMSTLPGVNRANSLVVSAKDTSVMVAAVVAGTRQIFRTANGGGSWTSQLSASFGEYGLPIEISPDKPDTIWFGGDSSPLRRSIDGGVTWPLYGSTSFRSPCDIVAVPGSDTYVYVGDGITGSGIGELWQSENGGSSFDMRQLVSGSEVPGMASTRLRNNTAFATTWGSVGARWTNDNGKNWPLISALNPPALNYSASWGADISRDDPDVVMIGQYSGSASMLSTDGGVSFSSNSLPGSNYSFLLRDRSTILAEQGGGIYKMRFTHNHNPGIAAASVAVTVPNGGESWVAGEVRNVTWNATSLAAVRIEWRENNAAAWQTVADVEGYAGSYAWTVPSVATTTAEVRVRDAWDGNPTDASDAVFTITVPGGVALTSPDGGQEWKYGTSHEISWTSTGIDSVAVEYRNAPANPWNTIAASLPAAQAAVVWVIPNDPTATAEVRVRNRAGAQEDVSAAPFAITVPAFAGAPTPLDLGTLEVTVGGSGVFDLDNAGTATLEVTAISSDNPRFVPGRTSLSIAAAGEDTLSVTFAPVSVGPDSATLTLTTDDPYGPHTLRVRANAEQLLSVGDERPTAFALSQNSPNPFSGSTRIRFGLPSASAVRLEIFDLQGHRVATLVEGEKAAGWHTVEFGPSMRDANGRPVTGMRSGVYFYRLTTPQFSATRRLLRL